MQTLLYNCKPVQRCGIFCSYQFCYCFFLGRSCKSNRKVLCCKNRQSQPKHQCNFSRNHSSWCYFNRVSVLIRTCGLSSFTDLRGNIVKMNGRIRGSVPWCPPMPRSPSSATLWWAPTSCLHAEHSYRDGIAQWLEQPESQESRSLHSRLGRQTPTRWTENCENHQSRQGVSDGGGRAGEEALSHKMACGRDIRQTAS